MVAVKPKDLAPTATVKFFGAGTAACVADLITFPLDTAKVRLQVREGKKILSHIHRIPFRMFNHDDANVCTVIIY